MTLNDMDTYLKSFNRKPGEYTEDEILEICLNYRLIQSSKKNWQHLADTLGINKSGSALRNWAYRQNKIKEELENLRNDVKQEVKEAKNQKINSISDFATLYKEKTQIRDIWNAYRTNLRHEARLERLNDTIKEIVSELKKLEPYTYVKTSSKPCHAEAIMLFSDLHIGVTCNNFYNTYNIKIARKRVSKYVEKTINYCKENDVKVLNVCNLGDCIHGITHTNARVQQETDAITQTMIAGEIIAQALNRLQEAAPIVTYRSCLDNHSRLMSNKEDNIECENLGRLIDWYLESRLADTKITFMKDNIDSSIGKFKLLNNKIVVFSHGHEDSKNQCFQNYVGATKEYIDYILLGHFHSGQMKQYQSAKVFINGSVVGTEDYALHKRLFSEPEQTLLIFKDDDVISYNINLNLN